MKKVKYPNLNDYDLSDYVELKGDILYKINGGTTMSSADQTAMAEAGKNGDKEAQAEIKAKYEKDDAPVVVPTNTTLPPTASSTANATPQQTTALATEQQVEEAKKDAEKKKSESSLCSSGGGSGSGNVNGGSSGSTSVLHGNTSNNPYEGRKTVLTSEEQTEMANKDSLLKKSGIIGNKIKSVAVEPVINKWTKSVSFYEEYKNKYVNNDNPYYHNGEDFIVVDANGNNVTRGRPVYSTVEGTVVGCECDDSINGADPSAKGNWVRLDIGNGWQRDYYHLSYTNLKVGDKVSVDTYIGSAGNTGASTNPHLHIDEFSYSKPSDYDETLKTYLAKSYNGGISYVYFRNPEDHR